MGESRKLWIEGPVGRLEAALRVASPMRAGAVLTHPHPLFGGSLHNPVVFHAERELNRAGLATLRFNFRGVGSSEGEHDDGRGEVEDVAAAVSWLRGIASGAPVLVVGYSFGAWCGLRYAIGDPAVTAVVAIGLPVGRFAVERVETLGRPLAVIQGTEDELGPIEEVKAFLSPLGGLARLYEVPGMPHLFPGRAADIALTVVEASNWCLSR